MATAGEKKLVAVENEMAGERAASLGRAGVRLRTAIENLLHFDELAYADARAAPPPTLRSELINIATEALSAYVVQREALGLYEIKQAVLEYSVPAEIWRRMGARRSVTSLR